MIPFNPMVWSCPTHGSLILRSPTAWTYGFMVGEKAHGAGFSPSAAASKGAFTPPDTIVLHLYGRYCNANKFARNGPL